MKNHFCDRKYTSWDGYSTPYSRRNKSCQMKYIHVTRKTFCDRKNTSCDKRSIISVIEGIFPVKEIIFLVTGISILSQEEQRATSVTGRIFQCAGDIILVTTKIFWTDKTFNNIADIEFIVVVV